MTRTTNQMFGKVARDIAATERLAQEDAADRQRRIDQEQARLDEPLTRRDVLDALETVASEYGCAGNEGDDRIADAFRNLAKVLT